MDFSLFTNSRSRFMWLMTLILLPLFFLNMQSSPDWEGDYAMYIMQAKHIAHGIPQSELPYIYNPDNPSMGPPAYTIGFPLLLSPVYLIAGNGFYAFTLWITAFLFGIGMVMALYLRRYFSDLITFFLVMIVIYNPWTLSMKEEVMSEFPFTFLLILCLLLFEKYSKGPFWMGIVIAILGGLLMSVRTIGVVFPIAVLAWAIRKRFIEKDKSPMNKCVCGFLVAVGSILTYLLLNNIVFAFPHPDGGYYAGIWGEESLYATVLYNLAYYAEQFKLFFSPWGGSWNFLPLVLNAGIFTFTLLGMIRMFFKRLELIDMIVILYFGVLLIYPVREDGIRLLFPIIPLLSYYLARGLESVSIFPRIRNSAKVWFLGCLVLVSYMNMIWFTIKGDDQVSLGPQDQAAVEAFEYIKQNSGKDDVIIFAKPRVLALYTERKCIANNEKSEPGEIADLIFSYDVDYVLTHTELSDEAINDFIRKQDYLCEYLWSNGEFVLFEVVLN